MAPQLTAAPLSISWCVSMDATMRTSELAQAQTCKPWPVLEPGTGKACSSSTAQAVIDVLGEPVLFMIAPCCWVVPSG